MSKKKGPHLIQDVVMIFTLFVARVTYLLFGPNAHIVREIGKVPGFRKDAPFIQTCQ